MELQQLIINIKRAHQMGNPPGNPNYRLMCLLADLVEYVGRLGDTIPDAVDSQLRTLVQEHDTALFYRKVEHLRQVGSDTTRRLAWLDLGTKAFGVDLKVVLLRAPKPATSYPSPMIA
ncbi:MAG: hypothetical protein QG626_675 [Patescibacteria group bacterium]|jgi:hypothetical protein|nr:hypothetical protein [Patescibacteria group bacterium]